MPRGQFRQEAQTPTALWEWSPAGDGEDGEELLGKTAVCLASAPREDESAVRAGPAFGKPITRTPSIKPAARWRGNWARAVFSIENKMTSSANFTVGTYIKILEGKHRIPDLVRAGLLFFFPCTGQRGSLFNCTRKNNMRKVTIMQLI